MSVDLEPIRTLYLVARQQKRLFFLPRVSHSIRRGVCLEAAGKFSAVGNTCPGIVLNSPSRAQQVALAGDSHEWLKTLPWFRYTRGLQPKNCVNAYDPGSPHGPSARLRLKQEISPKAPGPTLGHSSSSIRVESGAAQQLLVRTSCSEMNAEDQALTGSGQGATSSLLRSPAQGTSELVSCRARGFRAGEQMNSHVAGHLIQGNSP